MARIRTIKPEFFTSEDVVALSPLARLLFIGLWCEADREGRLEWRPGTIRLRYFPGDEVNVDGLADEMESRGMLARYRVDGKAYAELPSFTRHQVVNNRESPSRIPSRAQHQPPTERDASRNDDHASSIRTYAAAARDDACPTRADACGTPLVGREGMKGKEGASLRDAASLKPTKPVKTPLPADFGLTDELRDWARRKGVTSLDERLEYFVGKARANGYVYADWCQAFQNSCNDDWMGKQAGLSAHSKRNNSCSAADLPF